jgi:hypothetical protein
MTMNTTMNMKMRRRKDFKDKGVSLFASTLIRLLIIKTLTSAARLFLMKQIYNSLNQLETKGQILAPNSNVKTASLYPTSDFIPRLTSSQSVSKNKTLTSVLPTNTHTCILKICRGVQLRATTLRVIIRVLRKTIA